MTVRVPSTGINLYASDFKTARPASALRISSVCADNLNYLLGNLMGSVRCINVSDGLSTTESPVFRGYTYRHPNCDHLDFFILINETTEQTSSISVRAGTGSTKSYNYDVTQSIANDMIILRAPFDSNDSGDTPITITCVYCSPRSIVIADVPRKTLTTGDKRVELIDTAKPAIGLIEARVIAISSNNSGPIDIIEKASDAYSNYRPQIMMYMDDDSDPKTVTSGTWANFFNQTFKHKCRQKYSTDTRTSTKWRLRAWCSSEVKYDLRVSSTNPGAGANDSQSLTGQTNNLAGYKTAITDLMVDCTQDATITVEGQITSGSGTIYLSGCAGWEE